MIPSRVSADVSLQLVEPGHAEALFRITSENRTYLSQWLPWLDSVVHVDDTRAFIRAAQQQVLDNDGCQSVIFYRGEPVGMIGYHGIDWPQLTTSLGYWLAERMQGHGVVTEACRAHVGHAFDVFGLHCVKIRCAVGNAKSRAVPERLGFQCDGIIVKAEWLYDHFVDHAVYSMLARNWT